MKRVQTTVLIDIESSVWKYPEVPGIESFKGKLMHTASWDSEVDLQDKVVAVIGSGSSAVQVVPNIAPRRTHSLFNSIRY
jgi:cation diffusion facilitator CzcD-associated flavoprotein CzcO